MISRRESKCFPPFVTPLYRGEKGGCALPQFLLTFACIESLLFTMHMQPDSTHQSQDGLLTDLRKLLVTLLTLGREDAGWNSPFRTRTKTGQSLRGMLRPATPCDRSRNARRTHYNFGFNWGFLQTRTAAAFFFLCSHELTRSRSSRFSF